ncbi:response regulator transcription factor [Roseivirga sp. BDSF3-8]|uniref:response regulator transcription factor n=1 Tax=Roseivirga sp. BDSF3-8 TaxID=3241598 RepID=UPI0035327E60
MSIKPVSDRTYSILHVDDHEIVRIGIRTIIDRMPGFRLIDDDIKDGNRAMVLLSRYQPDLALLDVDLPGASGIEIARHIIMTKLPTKVVLLSNAITHYTFEECLSLNVMGFLSKSTPLCELSPCLDNVIKGNSYISTDCLDVHDRYSTSSADAGNSLLSVLSKTEIKVLKLIAIGKSTPEIAEEFCKSTRTIDSHRYNINQKLGLKGKHGLLSYAFQNKRMILSLPTPA